MVKSTGKISNEMGEINPFVKCDRVLSDQGLSPIMKLDQSPLSPDSLAVEGCQGSDTLRDHYEKKR